MDENILREIVARIMADPRLQPVLMAAAAKTTQQRQRLLIVVDSAAGLASLSKLQKKWSNSSDLSMCLAGSVSHPDATLMQVSCEQAMSSPAWDRILIPVCSVQQIGEIVLGFRRDKLTDLVAWALLQGIPLEIGRVDCEFTDKTPPAYRRRLESYIKQAAAYGITIGAAADAPVALPATAVPPATTSLPWSFGEPVKPAEPATRSAITYDKSLLTEKEAMLFPEHAVLMLDKPTVLTPSAIDLLKRQKVQVYKEGVRFL